MRPAPASKAPQVSGAWCAQPQQTTLQTMSARCMHVTAGLTRPQQQPPHLVCGAPGGWCCG